VREFQERYETAVPELPIEAVERMVSRRAPWSEMLALIERSAPHGFLIYYRDDAHPRGALADHRRPCVAYVMGSHTIAEQMFRYDPRAMLYASLHTIIWEDRDGNAWFTVDQPRTRLASFGIPEVAEAGVVLDRKLAALLEVLAAPVPDALVT
jgi:hypothetical protein